MNHVRHYKNLKQSVEDYLEQFLRKLRPSSLYEPIRYVMEGGGKRIRPALVLLSCSAVKGDMKGAIHAGAAIELLHNFTLIHDDIMDHAEMRRGRATVHTKWDTETAILVGDAMMCLAYRALYRTRSKRLTEIFRIFNEAILEVCEGQSYDKGFEKDDGITLNDYLMMISKKTGRLVIASAQVGAVIGNATKKQFQILTTYTKHIGRAFQIQDDLLDVVADEAAFGKKIGSDIREGKKTFLLLEALRHAQGNDRELLENVIKNHGAPENLIDTYKQIYERTGAIRSANAYIQKDIRKASTALNKLAPNTGHKMLSWFTEMLLERTF
jgi:geranylgeranyl diphosphate synthase type II